MLVVGLIPARAGSVRIPKKNSKPLAGKPLILWTIDAAQQSELFSEIIVSTDDPEIGAIAEHAGVRVHLRPAFAARDDAPDIAWVRMALSQRPEDVFCILRPTSPFRTCDTIRRAWATFRAQQPCDSLRAVEKARQHPGKMWVRQSSLIPGGTSDNPLMGSAFCRERLAPLMPFAQAWQPLHGQEPMTVPWHSSPTQTLPEVYVQNASLEIAWRYTVLPPSLTVAGTYGNDGTISGTIVAPFFTQGWEGFDINSPDDWTVAEAHAQTLLANV